MGVVGKDSEPKGARLLPLLGAGSFHIQKGASMETYTALELYHITESTDPTEFARDLAELVTNGLVVVVPGNPRKYQLASA